MRRIHRSLPSAQRGIGALVVVLVLFLILSMVALYTSRNLIFEQKTSANVYRSTQAFEAAEAGVEWAIAMLNGGRINNSCVPPDPVDTTLDTFRERHLQIGGAGGFMPKTWVDAGAPTPLQPSCVLGANGWNCSCPADAGPALVAPAGSSPQPSFRVTFEDVGGQPGMVRLISDGCSSFGTPCIADAAIGSDATASVSTLLGLAPSLTQTPAAALTVRGGLTADDVLVVTNTDRASNGVTIDAGGPVDAPLASLSTLPGTPSDTSKVELDNSLSGLAPVGGQTPGDMMFLATFGMDAGAYRTQPAVVRVKCAIPCNGQLQTAADQYPGRTIWIDPGPGNPDGDLVVDASSVVTLGSAAAPVIVVVGSDISFGNGSSVTINGMVYSRGASLTATGSTTLVLGAFIAEGVTSGDLAIDGNFEIVGAPSIVFDRDIVDHLGKVKQRLVMDFGSFVRVPGSWKDWKDFP